jgi:hypothetical protein
MRQGDRSRRIARPRVCQYRQRARCCASRMAVLIRWIMTRITRRARRIGCGDLRWSCPRLRLPGTIFDQKKAVALRGEAFFAKRQVFLTAIKADLARAKFFQIIQRGD